MERARVYVSISPDLGQEREVVGRAVAALPVDLGWEVAYTPGPLDPTGGNPWLAGQAMVYLFALGADIRAPMGVEWTAARRAGVTPLTLLKDVPRTPAAQEFVKTAHVDWTTFKTAADLAPRVQLALAQAVLANAGRFSLTTTEWEALTERVEALRDPQSEPEDDTRSGAGGGGVIFAPSREAGRGGVVIRDA